MVFPVPISSFRTSPPLSPLLPLFFTVQQTTWHNNLMHSLINSSKPVSASHRPWWTQGPKLCSRLVRVSDELCWLVVCALRIAMPKRWRSSKAIYTNDAIFEHIILDLWLNAFCCRGSRVCSAALKPVGIDIFIEWFSVLIVISHQCSHGTPRMFWCA